MGLKSFLQRIKGVVKRKKPAADSKPKTEPTSSAQSPPKPEQSQAAAAPAPASDQKPANGSTAAPAQQATAAAADPAAPEQSKATSAPTNEAAPAAAVGNDGAVEDAQQPITALATPAGLSISLVNRTNSNTVFAYITGLDLNRNNTPLFIQSDGHTVYHPPSPGAPLAPLGADCAIPLGGPGSTKNVTIPKIAGGRIWYVIGSRLTFFINPGPAIVEPSVTNKSDANYNHNWSFAEFTYNDAQLYANISYVDFVGIPAALTLRTAAGRTQHVGGMDQNGLAKVVAGLRAQDAKDKAGWGQLVVNGPNGQPLRALSPNNAGVMNASLFQNYFNPYVDRVWAHYATTNLVINTQARWGNVTGRVAGDSLNFAVGADLRPGPSFRKPSSRDVFTCSTGPFANADPEALAITPRLTAALHRGTALLSPQQPDGVTDPARYYHEAVTNHYARICHESNVDRKGYAFPYDDVVPDGGRDQSGSVFAGDPVNLTVEIGGHGAHA